MVRTKAGSVSTKAVGAKAPQKVAITAILSGNAPKGRNHSGGNSYHPRETPGWQKPITFFMKGGESSKDVSKEEDDKDEGIPGIVGKKSSKKTLETDMEVEVTEEMEVKKKRIKLENSEKDKEIKKHNAKEEDGEKEEEAEVSEDFKEAEEAEDEGIPGISATDSSEKILEAHDDMDVEETEDVQMLKEKVKVEDSKEIDKEQNVNKYGGEDKENDLEKVDTRKKNVTAVPQDEDENKENQFKKNEKKEVISANEEDGENKENQLKKNEKKEVISANEDDGENKENQLKKNEKKEVVSANDDDCENKENQLKKNGKKEVISANEDGGENKEN